MAVSPGHLDSLLNASFAPANTSGVSIQSETGAAATVSGGGISGSYSTVTLNTTGVPPLGLLQGQGETLNITGVNDTDNSITYSISVGSIGGTTVPGITLYVVGYSANGLLLSAGTPGFFAEELTNPNLSFSNDTDAVISSAPIAAQSGITFTSSGSSTVTPGGPATPVAPPPIAPPVVTPPATTPPSTTEVTLHGSSSQYIIADDNGSLYIQDTMAGRDGIQTLTGINEITFTDGVGIFDPTGAAEDVSRLYYAALGRAPDVSGLESWTTAIDDSNAPLTSVASSLATSPEFIQHYGSLADADFVNQLYLNVLGRPADASGAQFWDGVLGSGTSRGAVLVSFAESPENKAKTLSTAGDENSAEAYRLYQAGLDRAPDASGLTFWASALANGATPTQVAQDFINSAEFQQDFGSLSGSAFVSQLYQNVLHRAADPSGLQFWTNALQQGASEASVLVGLSDSPENRIQTASATHANWVFIPS